MGGMVSGPDHMLRNIRHALFLGRVDYRMPKITVKTIVKLALACLLVGLVLSTLDIDPRNILDSGRAAIEALIELGGEFFGWAVTYILIGAVIVVPIWLITYLFKAARGQD